ncbi:MAG TPA: CAP domain-containing protein [Dongiaceae bacterium]|nr:CAP domain-containing protein [Dongiaceae bacterium]
MSGRFLSAVFRVFAGLALVTAPVFWFAPVSLAADRPSDPAEQALFDAVNHERGTLGLRPLQWDTALANAARLHTTLLASHDELSHRFNGEADLQTRLRLAGARFSLVAENVAQAPQVTMLHVAWMNSAPHRANILDPQLDSIGIAVERRGDELYATQDFSASVAQVSREQQEQLVARLLQSQGVAPSVSEDARRSCDANLPSYGGPVTILRFETSDLNRLPNDLARLVSGGRFRRAALAACEAPAPGPFVRFRFAVLLYP